MVCVVCVQVFQVARPLTLLMIYNFETYFFVTEGKTKLVVVAVVQVSWYICLLLFCAIL